MEKEALLIYRFQNALSLGDNICYFGIDLITEDYNPVRLAELAKKQDLSQRLGYLAEVCAQAAEVTHIPEESKLTRLYKSLEDSFEEWQHLESEDWGDAIIKSRMERGSLDASIRKKWKIYSTLELEEIEDWIDLYVTKDFLNYTPWERYEMGKKGIKYTRLIKNRKNAAEKSIY